MILACACAYETSLTEENKNHDIKDQNRRSRIHLACGDPCGSLRDIVRAASYER